MNFEEYQKESAKTAVYPDEPAGLGVYYTTLGLTGEAGEVADKVKKIFRDDHGLITTTKIAELEKELGDVLWYAAQLATELGLNLQDIAEANIEKLQSRRERGAIHGSGDDR